MSRMTSKDLSIIDEEEYKDQVVLELTPTIFTYSRLLGISLIILILEGRIY